MEFTGDVGGFNVGSTLSWLMTLETQFKVSRLFALELGWNVLDINYEGTVRDERFVYNARAAGSMLSFVFHF